MVVGRAITTGTPVFTADGVKLGEVKTVEEHYFQVAAAQRGQPDFWLELGDVVSPLGGDRVVVSFDFEDLEDHKAGHEVG